MDDVFRTRSFEHIASTDKHVDTRSNQTWCCFTLHTTVDFYQCTTARLIYELTQSFYFLNRILNELLSTEARIHTHQKHHIHITDHILEDRDRRCRIQRHTSLHTSLMNLLNSTVQVQAGLLVHIHHHSTKLCRLLNITLRFLNHEMNIKRLLTCFRHSFQYGEAKRYVGHKRTIHHVQVKPVGLRTVNHLNILVEMQEIGR